CISAAREGHSVSIDYLESLGALRWIVAVGFFGFYLIGYVLLWALAQILGAIAKPRDFLPWFGLQAFGFVLIIVALVAGGVSDSIWQRLRGPGPAMGMKLGVERHQRDLTAR